MRVFVHPATDHAGSVVEAIDTVPSGRTSILLVGDYNDVARIARLRTLQFAGAMIVAQHGQGAEHHEIVIHRPHSAVRE